MIWRRRKRQTLLFLGAILLPAVVLVGLAVRVFRQETELVQKRAVEERLSAFNELRRELAARLEAIKLQEINRLMRAPNASLPEHPDNSPVVLIAKLKGERFIPPWPTAIPPGRMSSRVASDLEDGELLEFASGRFDSAASLYGDAVASSRNLQERCDSELHLGRVQIKSGQSALAHRVYLRMLASCGSSVDEFGIPLNMYASERLLNAGLDPAAASRFLISEASAIRWRSPVELALLDNLLAAANIADPRFSVQSLSARNDVARNVIALYSDFPKVLARMEPAPNSQSRESVWVAFGSEPWLITTTANTPPLPPLVFTIASGSVTPPGTRLTTVSSPISEGLGEGFPGLRVEWDRKFTPARTVPVVIYLSGVILILTLTLLIGYLLLRDVDRDMQMAELRSHFVASVSHDLKTPLTVIRMYAEMLMRGHVEDRRTVREYHTTILNESERLTQLVENVLDFSRVEHGSISYVLRPVSLADVVRSAAAVMEYPLIKDGFTLETLIDDGIPSVPADSAALEQAVINLLTNAIKYSGDSRRIELLLRRRDSDVSIEVRDWGIGIDPEHHSRIFEKFFRVHSQKTEAITGAGLGLTLVAHIAHGHGGKVEVTSAVGEGSTFAIRIPVQMKADMPEVPA